MAFKQWLKSWYERNLIMEEEIMEEEIIDPLDSVDDKNPEDLTYHNDGLSDHTHKWKRGMLPGQKYIKTCSCGAVEEVTNREVWLTLG